MGCPMTTATTTTTTTTTTIRMKMMGVLRRSTRSMHWIPMSSRCGARRRAASPVWCRLGMRGRWW